MDSIQVANCKDVEEFRKTYLPSWSADVDWTHNPKQQKYLVELHSATSLSSRDFEACFSLIEQTSKQDYKSSSIGWNSKSKRKEMKLLDLKYILLKHAASFEVQGFVSFMPTHEDDCAVVYCYEIHVAPLLQGSGFGTRLMSFLGQVAVHVDGVEKIMLTCFTANENAMRFYARLGFVKDDFSPPARKLRNGTIVEPDYIILSCPSKES